MSSNTNKMPSVRIAETISEELRDEIVGSVVDCLEELVFRLPGTHWDNISHVEIRCVPAPENEVRVSQ